MIKGMPVLQNERRFDMQNAVNQNENEKVVGITSAHVNDAIKRVHESNNMFAKQVIENASRLTDNVCIVKKDGTKEAYNVQKVVNAVKKSATRMLITFTDEEVKRICDFVNKNVSDLNKDEVSIWEIHNIVENALESINPAVAKSYRNYRNYKTDFVAMLDKVYQESQKIMYIGDKENSNSDSALVSTKRSLIFNQLNKELYKKFFLTVEDLQAIREGYIYIHDMSARRDTMNCCLFNVAEVLKGGFEMGNLWYNEPKTLDVAFDVIGDIVMAAASQQYGGFTVPEVDKILASYAQKSYEKQYNRYLCMGLSFEKAREEALKDV
jgi:ribonucleoside-triphosphate reductase